MTTATAMATADLPTRAGDHLVGTGKLLRLMLRRDRKRLPGWTLGLALLMAYFTTALQTVLATPEDLAGVAGFAESPVGALFGGPGHGYEDLTIERFPRQPVRAVHPGRRRPDGTAHRHPPHARRGAVRSRGAGPGQRRGPPRATHRRTRLGRPDEPAGRGPHRRGDDRFRVRHRRGAAVRCQHRRRRAHFRRDRRGHGPALGVPARRGRHRRDGARRRVRAARPRRHGRRTGERAVLAVLAVTVGWSQQTAPFVLDRWWPLAFSLAFAALAALAGYALSDRRDLGAALVPPRTGSATAAAWLRHPLAVAFRLQRASLVGWSLGLLVGGLAYGSFTQPMLDGFADAPADLVAVMGGSEDMLSGFLGLMGLMMAFTVAVFAVLAMQSLRGEETDGRTEPVLATAVSRSGWLGSHVVVTGLGVVWLLLVAGAGMGVGAAVSTGDAGLVGELVLGHVAHAPAVWLVLAVAALLYGAVPRALPAVWLLVGYGVLVGFFAPILDISETALHLSPFEHVGEYPLDDIAVGALLILTAVAAVVLTAALGTFRRRDLTTT